MPDQIDPKVQDILLLWVRSFPHPLLFWGDGGTVIFENELWKAVFRKHTASEPRFDREERRLHLPLEDGEFVLSYDDLSPGDYFVKSLHLRGPRPVNLEVAKVTMGNEPYFCCMLLPGHGELGIQFSGLFDSIESWIMEIDEAGRIVYVNAPTYTALGYTDGSDRPVQLKDYEEGLTDQIFQDRIAKLSAREIIRYDTHYRSREGTLVPSTVTMMSHRRYDGKKRYLLSVRDTNEGIESARNPSGAGTAREIMDSDHQDIDAKLQEFSYLIPTDPHAGEHAEALLKQIEQVAPTDVPVLIWGEKGTAKNLIGKVIHRMSQRSEMPFIHVRCDSLPSEMLENELFGYESSVFTGSFKDRIGRVMAAQGGTLMLDEIGQLTLPLQRRIMMLLQEGLYQDVNAERRDIDIRLIATTSEDLQSLVEAGKFRDDLRELLMGFPIRSKSLRERRQDIPRLVNQYIAYYNSQYQRKVTGVDEQTLNRLVNYDFPGNLDELEHLIEHAFRVSNNDLLPVALPGQSNPPDKPLLDVSNGMLTEFLSLDEYQKKYIQMVLDSTNGKVSGPNGAAEILKVNPQTLFSKMKRLGIKR